MALPRRRACSGPSCSYLLSLSRSCRCFWHCSGSGPSPWENSAMFDVQKIRGDFPILARKVNDQPLTYLDNGASAQKPQVVIDAVTRGYAEEYSNVHRGLHYLSNLATEKYEGVRETVARFLGVADEDQIILNSGTTEGINMVAYGWAMPRMEAGDEIVLSVM